MYLAYSLLLSVGFLVLVPHFLFQALTHGKYIAGLRQRLGSLPPLADRSNPVIWLHCVSVGETQAARPLVERLKANFPQHSLVVSTITMTGQKLARDLFEQQASDVFYFPLDWRWSVRRALKAINPSAVLIMETELWPNFLRECDKQRIPVALVNGRISKQSFRRYSLIRVFFRRMLSSLTMAVMQSEPDAERIATLGMPREKLFVSGNLKFDSRPTSSAIEKTGEIRQRFGFQEGVALILAASTHSPEEKIILESFLKLKKTRSVRLMLAPRHPERFQEVASLLQDSGLNWTRRTATPNPNDTNADVVLLDTIGELPATYPLAAIVFVGGSIIERGGHNVLEPGSVGACVVTGAHTDNFHAIVALLNQADALIQLRDLTGSEMSTELTGALAELLDQPERRKELGERARQLVLDNQGATDRTIQLIKPLLLEKPVESRQPNSALVTDVRIP
jgi:3-deoxy-D-manno-octulosonic-acid transferase